MTNVAALVPVTDQVGPLLHLGELRSAWPRAGAVILPHGALIIRVGAVAIPPNGALMVLSFSCCHSAPWYSHSHAAIPPHGALIIMLPFRPMVHSLSCCHSAPTPLCFVLSTSLYGRPRRMAIVRNGSLMAPCSGAEKVARGLAELAVDGDVVALHEQLVEADQPRQRYRGLHDVEQVVVDHLE
jgi:hypothetical protein